MSGWADVPADKVRPVLVLTRERFLPRLTSLLVAPVTTTVRCAANFDNVFTLHQSRFQQRITRLTIERMQEVCRAYRFAAECG